MNISEYQGIWEKYSTVRTCPPRVYTPDLLSSRVFSKENNVLFSHPEVLVMSGKDQNYILTQSAYWYMAAIALIESEVINKIATKIANGRYKFDFLSTVKQAAWTIVIDEAYHAYVADDCILQIAKLTGIQPVLFPKTTQLAEAIRLTKDKIDKEHYSLFELIAICIAENTLTQDILLNSKVEGNNAFYQRVLKDHLLDEGRHSQYFKYILNFVWQNIDNSIQLYMIDIIISFLKEYLNVKIDKEVSSIILRQLDIPIATINTILDDCYLPPVINPTHHLLKNIMKLFNHCGMLNDEEVVQKFQLAGLVY